MGGGAGAEGLGGAAGGAYGTRERAARAGAAAKDGGGWHGRGRGKEAEGWATHAGFPLDAPPAAAIGLRRPIHTDRALRR
jgi:hypothetical protein